MPDWPEDRADWTPAHVAAVRWASELLRSLTGGRFGLCQILVRPCRKRCAVSMPASPGCGCGSHGGNSFLGGGGNWPVNPVNLGGGEWLNMACGNGCASDCSCKPLCEVELPGPVYRILEVRQDGKCVPGCNYRLDGGRSLVRTDGHCWPECQDMSQSDCKPGTFSVRYLIGRPITAMGTAAVSALALEKYRMCVGDRNCRLSPKATQVTRDGITIDLDPNLWLNNGLTGIPEADMWLKAVNPHSIRTPPSVWSPDFPQVRTADVPMYGMW